MNAFYLLVVAAEQRIPADDGNILQHSHSVFQVADASALVVRPTYGHLRNAVAAL
jgi:hypothetical protein